MREFQGVSRGFRQFQGYSGTFEDFLSKCLSCYSKCDILQKKRKKGATNCLRYFGRSSATFWVNCDILGEQVRHLGLSATICVSATICGPTTFDHMFLVFYGVKGEGVQ